MRKCWMRFGLSAVCAAVLGPVAFGQYATSVISYNAGTGAQSGYNHPEVALGSPATTDGFGGAVDPTNPPFLNSAFVSIGAGGSLTVQFGAPILNSPSNPFGLDFIVYGNAGFIYDFNANQTDGTLFGAASAGATRVSVSADGVNFFTLDTSLAPVVDSYFPTDSAGAFGVPVNPALANSATFNGKSLDGIRALYAGSGGGAGFDLDWARDGNGNAVALGSANFVRVDVLSGKAEVDALAAVPEPSTWALLGLGGALLIGRKRRA
jgi:hypothetical protein